MKAHPLFLLITFGLLAACDEPPAQKQVMERAAQDSLIQAIVEESQGIERVGGQWRLTEEVDPVDDTKRTVLYQPSQAEGITAADASLFIRCQNNETELFITWDEYLDDSPMVTYRLDSAKAVARRWTESSDNEATFFPGSPVSFIKQLISTKTLNAKVTPYRESAVYAKFDLSGLDSALAPVREQCHW